MVAVARYLHAHHSTGLEHCRTRVHHHWLVIDEYFNLFRWLFASSCCAICTESGSSCVCVCVCVCEWLHTNLHFVYICKKKEVDKLIFSAKACMTHKFICLPEALARRLALPAKCLSILETRTLTGSAFEFERFTRSHDNVHNTCNVM